MQTWSITLHGPAGVISTVDTGESQFVVGTETASDVFTIHGEGVMPRNAWVWISEAGLQVEDLAGGTLNEFAFAPFPQLARAVSSRGALRQPWPDRPRAERQVLRAKSHQLDLEAAPQLLESRRVRGGIRQLATHAGDHPRLPNAGP